MEEVLQRMPPLNVFLTMAHAETAFRPWMRWGGVLLNDLALDPVLRLTVIFFGDYASILTVVFALARC